MTKAAIEKPASRQPVITPYRVMWSTLGSLAVVYLGVALFAPAWLGDLTPSAAERQREDTQPQITRLLADMSGVRASLTRLGFDIESARTDAAAQASATKALEDRVTELEQKARANPLPPVADAAPAVSAPGASAAIASQATSTPAEPTVAADTAPAPSSAPKVLNPNAATTPSIVTGSIDAKPATPLAAKKSGNDAISFGPAVVKPAAKPVGIQIASDVSLDGLRQRWTELSTMHADQLKKLGARYAPGGDSANPTFNLVAGPIKSRADAKKICKDLEAHDVLCKVSEFKGDTL